jgi:hypothetical protein
LRLLDLSEREPRLPGRRSMTGVALCLLRELDCVPGVASSRIELMFRGERTRTCNQRLPRGPVQQSSFV